MRLMGDFRTGEQQQMEIGRSFKREGFNQGMHRAVVRQKLIIIDTDNKRVRTMRTCQLYCLRYLPCADGQPSVRNASAAVLL